MEEGKEGEKGMGKVVDEERMRKDSTSSVGSSVGSLKNFWGKKREREEEKEDVLEEKGVFNLQSVHSKFSMVCARGSC